MLKITRKKTNKNDYLKNILNGLSNGQKGNEVRS